MKKKAERREKNVRDLRDAACFIVRGRIWLYPGNAAWHFFTLPKRDSAVIRKLFGGMQRGWGSLPVKAALGKTAWKTSIFPDRKRGAYVLPIKADVRRRERLRAGSAVEIVIRIET